MAPGLESGLPTAGVVLSPLPVSSRPASLLPAGHRPHRPLSALPSPRAAYAAHGGLTLLPASAPRALRRGCPCPPARGDCSRASASFPAAGLVSACGFRLCRLRVVVRSSMAGTLPILSHCSEHRRVGSAQARLLRGGSGWPAEPRACAVGTITESEASSTLHPPVRFQNWNWDFIIDFKSRNYIFLIWS